MKLPRNVPVFGDLDFRGRCPAEKAEQIAFFSWIRAAYFCWLREKQREASHDGSSIDEMHMKYKATYLLPILCARNVEFADLVIKMLSGGVEKNAVLKLLSVADSSITTSEIMLEYFTACQRGGWDRGAE